MKFDDADWKVACLNHMSANRVFRSGSLLEVAAKHGASKRSVDYLISALTQEGRIYPAQRGLYFINHEARPVNAAEIAAALNPAAIVSLDSSFRPAPNNGLSEHPTHLVSSSGRIGKFKSPLGPIAIHRLSDELVDAVISQAPSDLVFSRQPYGHSKLRVFSPEVALIHIHSLNNLSRRGSSYGSDLPPAYREQVDVGNLSRIANAISLDLDSIKIDLHSFEPSHSNQPGMD